MADEYIDKVEVGTKIQMMYIRRRGMRKALRIIENTPATDVQPVDRWTSVKDKLPNKCGYYLVWFSYTCQDVDNEYYCEDFGKAFYHDDFERWDVENMSKKNKPKVLYWQQATPPTKEANTK